MFILNESFSFFKYPLNDSGDILQFFYWKSFDKKFLENVIIFFIYDGVFMPLRHWFHVMKLCPDLLSNIQL